MTVNHRPKIPSFLVICLCMSYLCWLLLHCGFFGGTLPPHCLILINFGQTSISPSPLLFCCFWTALTQIWQRHVLFRKCLFNFFSSGANKTLWQCVPVQPVSLTLSLCECPHGGHLVQPHSQLVSSPSSACWQSLFFLTITHRVKTNDVCVKFHIRLHELLRVFMFLLAAVRTGQSVESSSSGQIESLW